MRGGASVGRRLSCWPARRRGRRRCTATRRAARKAKWTWLTPGTLFTAVGWLALFFGFGFYVSRFANYNATYGSLGAVVALLTFVYLASYIFLFGAELNSELEHQTAHDTTDGAPERSGPRRLVGRPCRQRRRRRGQGRGGGIAADQPSAEPETERANGDRAPASHPYLVSRATNRASRGRRRGARSEWLPRRCRRSACRCFGAGARARAGAALLATAAGLSLLRRKDED